jgi:putative membrane protein
MKQAFKMWNTLLLAALLPFALMSCGGGNTNTSHNDSVDSAKDVNEATAPVDNESSEFAVKAANGGLMEVKLGELAQQNASSPRVKAFGQMMVQDHSDSVGEDHSKHIQDLSKKTGKDFDKAYIDMMVDDHNEDVDMFDKASKDLKDADLKGFAAKTLPVLRTHLDSAKAVQESLRKNKNENPRNQN